MIERLKELERESDIRTQKLVEEQTKVDIKNFDPAADAEILPYEDEELFFMQQGKRIIWMKEGNRYCSARYYPSIECAAQAIDELKKKGGTTDIEVWKQ